MINEKRLPRPGCILEKDFFDCAKNCEKCGFHEAELKRRKAMIRAGKLTKNRLGYLRLDLR